MKPEELRQKSIKELLKLKKDLEFNLAQARCKVAVENIKNKEAGINIKSGAKKGLKTSLQKQIKRTIAQINTIIREKEIENGN